MSVPAREALESSCLKAIKWAREELGSEECVLLDIFLEYDSSMDAKIDLRELEKMLRSFDNTASDEKINKYKEELLKEGAEHLSFVDLCKWWKSARDRDEGSTGKVLTALLTARYLSALAGRYTWGLVKKTPFEARLQELPTDSLEIAATEYKYMFYELKSWLAQESIELTFKQLKERVARAAQVVYPPFETRYLSFLFDTLTKSTGVCTIKTDLPHISALLGYDVPLPVLEATREVFQSDAISFEEFLRWWAARPDSGKL